MTDKSVAVPNAGGAAIRTVEVTTTVDGVATSVEQQVVTLADRYGNLLDDADERRVRRALEYTAVSQSDAIDLALMKRSFERPNLTDRRGSVDRGSSR